MRSETFATPGPVTLQINIPAGEVDVETAETAETVVELEVRGRDQDEAEREARIESRARGEGREVVIDADTRGGFRDADYRVRVVAPHGVAIRGELASADIRGRGRYADLELEVASSDVEFDEVEREAKINTASGDVEIRRAGSVRINSASGDVRLRKVAQGDVKVHSASGDVEVGIAKGSRLWVDAQSLSGETSSELELEAGPAEDDQGPLVELRVQTMSGDISIRRA